MHFTTVLRGTIFFTLFGITCSTHLWAQNLLSRPVSVTVTKQPISEVLRIIGKEANFYFSYNSNLIAGDSLVSLSIQNGSVRSALIRLFSDRYRYKETGNHVIILPVPKETHFTISGYVLDKETGEKAPYVSVYDKKQVVATLTNEQGYFNLRLKGFPSPTMLSISKIGYADTTVAVQPNDEIIIRIQQRPIPLDPITVSRFSAGEQTWLGRLFLSRYLRTQSSNLGRFFVTQPYQLALIPGLGTHGRLSSQVVNRFSLNLIGGYAAGVNGLEIGGIFNIVKKEVEGFQVAGLFNQVGGHVNGVQMAGIYNTVLDSLKGVQLAGSSNVIKRSMNGLQVAGIFNQVKAHARGLQLAGVLNIVQADTRGLQVAGIINKTQRKVNGMQLAGLYNVTSSLRGVQVGLVNQADTSYGYSIGLVNLIGNGKFTLDLSTNETFPVNAAMKTGTRQFYTIVLLGASFGTQRDAFSVGIGLGTEFRLFQKANLSTELTAQTIFLGNWQTMPTVYRIQPGFQYQFTKHIGVLAGPVFSILHTAQTNSRENYLALPGPSYHALPLGGLLWYRWGFQAGINFAFR